MPTKIEDGFETSPPRRPLSSQQPTTRSTMTPTMILSVIAIALFAGGLGFLGGMQINKSPHGSMAGNMPSGNSAMAPPQQSGSSASGGTAQTPPNSSGNISQPTTPQNNGAAPNVSQNAGAGNTTN